jgi:DNA-binding CsgD family transcriptional regulator
MTEFKMAEEDICNQNMIPAPNAFLIYRPEVKITKEVVFQNQEASKILSYPAASAKATEPLPEILSLCAKWKNLLKKKHKSMVESGNDSGHEQGSTPIFLELIKSGRRRYVVRGMVLVGQESETEQEANYLFLLDRISPEKINIPLIARQWQLSPREQDLVRLLLEDRSNKEIAHILELSINTVKAYLKMLMRKLNASSRAGIVSSVLTKQPLADVNEHSIIPGKIPF